MFTHFLLRGHATGAGHRLYMIKSADARPALKKISWILQVPGRIYKDETHFHVQWCLHLYQNSPSFLTRNVLKTSGVCKGHLDLFLIRFVQVYMKLKGTNKHQRWNHLTTAVKRCIDPTRLDHGCCEMWVFTTTWGQLISLRF